MHNFQKVHQGYGAAPRVLNFEQQPQQEVQQLQILTEAGKRHTKRITFRRQRIASCRLDQLCRGQVAETIIPLDNGRKFVVCLDDSKGVEQYCPKGLYYHMTSRRCERSRSLRILVSCHRTFLSPRIGSIGKLMSLPTMPQRRSMRPN